MKAGYHRHWGKVGISIVQIMQYGLAPVGNEQIYCGRPSATLGGCWKKLSSVLEEWVGPERYSTF